MRRMEQPWKTVKVYFKFLDGVDTAVLEQNREVTPDAKRDMNGLLCDILAMRDRRQFRENSKRSADRLEHESGRNLGHRSAH